MDAVWIKLEVDDESRLNYVTGLTSLTGPSEWGSTTQHHPNGRQEMSSTSVSSSEMGIKVEVAEYKVVVKNDVDVKPELLIPDKMYIEEESWALPTKNEDTRKQHINTTCDKDAIGTSTSEWFLCYNCEFKSLCKRSLECHIVQQHICRTLPSNFIPVHSCKAGAKLFKCKVCQIEFVHSSSLKIHMKRHLSTQVFRCDVCEREFSAKNKLGRHLLKHTGQRPFKCDICGRKFSQKHDLGIHQRTHTGDKPFKCVSCAREFSQRANFVRHMRLHNGQKPFKCNVCELKFSQKHHFLTHQRKHTGEKPFQCNLCERRFSDKNCLRRHLRLLDRDKPLKCDVCKLTFCKESGLMRHQRTHAGWKPFACELCRRKFSRKSSLKRHLPLHANNEKEKVHNR